MSDKALQRFYWTLVAVWLLVIYFQAVGVDEIEHSHAAWLMGQRGLVPFKDFFQHHTPLLWDVLKLYFLLGGSGPEVLYFGRLVVVLCALLIVWGFHVTGESGATSRASVLPRGMLGTGLFIAITIMIPDLFTIRPESMAIALFVWSYVFWIGVRRKQTQTALLSTLFSGVLLGLSVLFSPRMLLLGGVFLLPLDNGHLPAFFDLRRLATLGAGALAAICGYLALSDTTLNELHFALTFSTMVQQVGDGAFPQHLFVASVVMATVGVFVIGVLQRCGRKERARYLLIDASYLILVILISFFLAGKYVYGQDLVPIITLLALLFVRGQRYLLESPVLRDLFFGVTIALWVLLLSVHLTLYSTGAMLDFAGGSGRTLVEYMHNTKNGLAAIPSGESVILETPRHPIAVDDASFYVHPLVDAPDRLCTAVRLAEDKWPLPECDYLHDLKTRRPYLVTTLIETLASGERLNGIRAFLDKYYKWCGRYYVRLSNGVADCSFDPR